MTPAWERWGQKKNLVRFLSAFPLRMCFWRRAGLDTLRYCLTVNPDPLWTGLGALDTRSAPPRYADDQEQRSFVVPSPTGRSSGAGGACWALAFMGRSLTAGAGDGDHDRVAGGC